MNLGREKVHYREGDTIDPEALKLHRDQQIDFDVFDCGICYRTESLSRVFVVKKCKHFFCKECFADYFTVMVDNNQVNRLTCPKCKVALSAQEKRAILSDSTYRLYLARKLEQEVAKDHKERRFCPTPGCGNILAKKDTRKLRTGSNEIKCAGCN